jgi:hypothetical protein
MLEKVGGCKRVVAANSPVFTLGLVANVLVLDVEGLYQTLC